MLVALVRAAETRLIEETKGAVVSAGLMLVRTISSKRETSISEPSVFSMVSRVISVQFSGTVISWSKILFTVVEWFLSEEILKLWTLLRLGILKRVMLNFSPPRKSKWSFLFGPATPRPHAPS